MGATLKQDLKHYVDCIFQMSASVVGDDEVGFSVEWKGGTCAADAKMKWSKS